MPNIELHGYTPHDAIRVRDRIRTLLGDLDFAPEIVTTTIPSVVEGLTGDRMPFLRIISGPDGLDYLKERLRSLGEDIEVFALYQWIPKERQGG